MKPKLQRVQRVCERCGGEEFMPAAKCAWCNSRHLRKPLPGEEVMKTTIFIALGGGAWGMGVDADQAGQAMLKNWPRFHKMQGAKVQLWQAPRGSYVNMHGQISYPKDKGEPVLILEKTL